MNPEPNPTALPRCSLSYLPKGGVTLPDASCILFFFVVCVGSKNGSFTPTMNTYFSNMIQLLVSLDDLSCLDLCFGEKVTVCLFVPSVVWVFHRSTPAMTTLACGEGRVFVCF